MEKKFMIMTDVTTDLSEQWFIDNDVIPAIHGIVMDGVETWFDFGRTLRTKDVYAKIRSGVMPSTLQVQYDQFVRDFSEACEKGMDAMYVGFSSAMSGCVSTSMMAAQEVMEKYPDRKVITVDSLSASLGNGLLAAMAAQLRDKGMTAEETAKILDEKKYNVHHFFTVDDLNHLYRGGRLSKTSAVMGTLMGIKPILHINTEGKLVPLCKCRGRRAAMEQVAELTAKHIRAIENQTLYVLHGDCEDEAKVFADLILQRIPTAHLEIRCVGPIIGTHVGPGILATVFMGDARIQTA